MKLLFQRKSRFYVDATGGNDANSGRTPGDPWQTIAKINGYTFQDDDQILFKRGETWVGVALTVPHDNLVFDAYGSGANPIIDGNDLINCIIAVNTDNLAFYNLDITQGLDFGFYFTGCQNITVVNCDAHDCGNAGLEFDACSNCSVTHGNFYNTYQRVGGSICAGITIGDDAHDIVIDNASCYGGVNIATSGISIHNHLATEYPYNIVLQNCATYENAGSGIQLLKQDDTADTDRNITIKNCLGYDNGLYGIYINKVGANYVDGVTIQESETRSNTNEALRVYGDNITIRNTVISADADRNTWFSSCKHINFWNNTLYMTAAMATDFLLVIDGARTENFVMKNCILRAENAAVHQVSVVAGCGLVGMDIDYNLWGHTAGQARWWWLGGAFTWANWLINSGQDANSPIPADPLFVNPGANDFTLQAGSPAINAGVDVGLPYLGIAPDCGYAERE